MDIFFSFLAHLDSSTPLWWLLVSISFFTAAFTAAVGVGGGVLLIAVMASLLPPVALIPVHGVVQMVSNTSRAAMLRLDVVLPLLVYFTIGSLLGAVLGGQIVVSLPENTLRIILGSFILLICWLPPLKMLNGHIGRKGKFTIVGGLSTLVSMFVGATGPFVKSLLSRENLHKKQMVGTHAACMVVQHGLKIMVFGFLGFSFAPYLGLIVLMSVSGFVGTFVGLKVLHHLPEHVFKITYKIAITLLAIQLLAKGFGWM